MMWARDQWGILPHELLAHYTPGQIKVLQRYEKGWQESKKRKA